MRCKGLLVPIILSLILLAKQAFCEVAPDFMQKIKTLKWIAYAPTNFNPDQDIYPTQDSIREDLATLYKYGFRGVVTYGSFKSLAEIPRIASEVGFTGVIMGIWDINNTDEIMNATLAMGYVDGYCIGNEGLNRRYDLETLKSVIASIKETTGKPATTTEEINDYYNNTLDLISVGDWVFPNIHPFLSEVKNPAKAAKWIETHYNILKKHLPSERIILFKEAGFPTAGCSGATQANQKEFFIDLESINIPFVYFEAFDQRWKTSLSVEPHWGLFDGSRRPKRFISSQKNS